MPTLVEIARALAGLWRLVHLDASGLGYFDRTLAGFWRSFRVALLVLPAYALIVPAQLTATAPTASWERIMLIEMLVYIASWFAFPVAAYEVCRRFDRESEYVGYIVIYNWSAILGVLLALALNAIDLAGVMPDGLTLILALIGHGALFAYLWYIARITLNVGGGAAALFVVLDIGISVALIQASAWMEQ